MYTITLRQVLKLGSFCPQTVSPHWCCGSPLGTFILPAPVSTASTQLPGVELRVEFPTPDSGPCLNPHFLLTFTALG